MTTAAVNGEPPAPKIDTTVPHSARIWNYLLGGKDNYAVDRAAGDQFRATFPGVDQVARASRQYLVRSTRYLAGEAGIRQFLDVGTGLPTADNTATKSPSKSPRSRGSSTSTVRIMDVSLGPEPDPYVDRPRALSLICRLWSKRC
jgi:hypothetical protein